MTGLWFKRSVTLGQDPDMQAVAIVHGGVSILVFEELMALSKITRGAGSVATTWDVIALRCYCTRKVAKAIVEALDANHLVEIDHDQTTASAVTLTVQGWAKWNPKDSTNAERQARYRDRRNGSRNGRNGSVAALEEEKENRQESSSATQPRNGGVELRAVEGGAA